MTGDNASLLIYACALADFAAIDRDKYDIVAVTGNSMGWYLALACAGILDFEGGARLVNNMGGMMHNHGKGGQIVWPIVDADWRIDIEKVNLVNNLIEESKVDFCYFVAYFHPTWRHGRIRCRRTRSEMARRAPAER